MKRCHTRRESKAYGALFNRARMIIPVLDQMVEEGIVVLSDVEIIKYTHSQRTGEEQAEENNG